MENVGILVWHIWFPLYLLTPDSDAFPGQHVQHAPPGCIPKVTATLTSEDQATSAILIEEVHLPIQVPTKYLSF